VGVLVQRSTSIGVPRAHEVPETLEQGPTNSQEAAPELVVVVQLVFAEPADLGSLLEVPEDTIEAAVEYVLEGITETGRRENLRERTLGE
jgi:hypothetical protein